jgi:hypothetical protein
LTLKTAAPHGLAEKQAPLDEPSVDPQGTQLLGDGETGSLAEWWAARSQLPSRAKVTCHLGGAHDWAGLIGGGGQRSQVLLWP